MLCHAVSRRYIEKSVRFSAFLSSFQSYSFRILQSKISTMVPSESSLTITGKPTQKKDRREKRSSRGGKKAVPMKQITEPLIGRSLLNRNSYPDTNSDMHSRSEDRSDMDEGNLSDNMEDGESYDSEISEASSSSYSSRLNHVDSSLGFASPDSLDSLESELRNELQKCISSLPPNFTTLKGNSLKSKSEPVATKNADIPTLDTEIKAPQLKERKKDINNVYLSVKDAIQLVNEREYTLISIDNEFFERSTSKVIEIGISIYSPSYQKFALFPHFLNLHFIIKEFINLRNGLFVPDSKMNNITGQSLIISREDIPRAMSLIFQILGPKICIVGHNVSGDIKSFKNLNYELPSNLKIIDTMHLWYSFIGSSSGKSSLSYILDKLNIPNAFLHNGVNDAYFTLVVALMLTSPELRNNLALKKSKKNPVESVSLGLNSGEQNPDLGPKKETETPPDFSNLSTEVAKIKMNRWLRKKSKAEEKVKKNLQKKNRESSSSVHIRCSIDGEAILQKQQMGLIKNKSGKAKNPPSNKFFKPVHYDEGKLCQKLEELNL